MAIVNKGGHGTTSLLAGSGHAVAYAAQPTFHNSPQSTTQRAAFSKGKAAKGTKSFPPAR